MASATWPDGTITCNTAISFLCDLSVALADLRQCSISPSVIEEVNRINTTSAAKSPVRIGIVPEAVVGVPAAPAWDVSVGKRGSRLAGWGVWGSDAACETVGVNAGWSAGFVSEGNLSGPGSAAKAVGFAESKRWPAAMGVIAVPSSQVSRHRNKRRTVILTNLGW